MTETRENFKSLSFKEKCIYITAITSFVIGWSLTVINFFLSETHSVEDSTLWILGQALIYTGSALGISYYVSSEINKLKKRLGDRGNED